MDYNKHCKIPFGDYAQVYDNTDNTMAERTVGAICLGPSGNLQGGYNFMKLSTGQKIHKFKFVHLPMTQDVIDRVLEIGSKQKDQQD